jgi:hypothetical protein
VAPEETKAKERANGHAGEATSTSDSTKTFAGKGGVRVSW